jgi:hypothetical protein
MPHGNAVRCRHDITPRRACKLCRAEDERMRRASKRKTQKINRPTIDTR